MFKRMNKRGDEGFKLVNLLIAIVVLVIIILGIFYVSNQGRNVGENIPSQVEVVTQACGFVASPDFRESYCNQIREVGKNKYVTCDYASETEGFLIVNRDQMKGICDTILQKNRIVSQINEMKLKSSATVNGFDVSSYKA